MKQKGESAFKDHYQNLFGSDTDNILKALHQENSPVLLFTPRNKTSITTLWCKSGLSPETLTWYPYAFKWPESVPVGTTLPGFEEKLIFPMSSSSLLPVIALDVQPTDLVLDACAAPGGKSLVITNHLNSPTQLYANDLSPERVVRLKRTFKDYLYSSVTVTQMPAERVALRQEGKFHKILIDAPCSSEQHVLNSPKHLSQWSLKRIQSLQKRQKSLIQSLSMALKPKGILVYATCAVTPEENEIIVNEIVSAHKDLTLLPWKNKVVPGGPGLVSAGLTFDPAAVRRILPSRDEGDPIFVAIFQKSA